MLLFLPGLICDSRSFAPQLATFPHAMAIEGYGMADSLDAMARQVLSEMDARDVEQLDVFGHSMGGRVAMEIIRLAPQRVRRLALVSTGIYPANDREAGARAALQKLGYEAGFEALVDQWLPTLLPDPEQDRALYDQLRAMFLSRDQAMFDAQIKALLARPPFDNLLPTIDCPVLVMTGECDVVAPPKQHVAIAEKTPGSRLVIVEGAGHMVMNEAPEQVNAAIADWLAMPAGRADG